MCGEFSKDFMKDFEILVFRYILYSENTNFPDLIGLQLAAL